MTIISFILQGHVYIISEDDGDPFTWPSLDAAYAWRRETEHHALDAAEAVTAVNVETGETMIL